jgi:hypothetical protein
METVVALLELALIFRSQKHDDLDELVIVAPESHTIQPYLLSLRLLGATSPEERNLCRECAKIDLETIFHADLGMIGIKSGIEVAKFGRRLEPEFTCYFVSILLGQSAANT